MMANIRHLNAYGGEPIIFGHGAQGCIDRGMGAKEKRGAKRHREA